MFFLFVFFFFFFLFFFFFFYFYFFFLFFVYYFYFYYFYFFNFFSSSFSFFYFYTVVMYIIPKRPLERSGGVDSLPLKHCGGGGIDCVPSPLSSRQIAHLLDTVPPSYAKGLYFRQGGPVILSKRKLSFLFVWLGGERYGDGQGTTPSPYVASPDLSTDGCWHERMSQEILTKKYVPITIYRTGILQNWGLSLPSGASV